jgi:hypothetical protein
MIKTREELSAMLANYMMQPDRGGKEDATLERERRNKEIEEVNEYTTRWIEMPWRCES